MVGWYLDVDALIEEACPQGLAILQTSTDSFEQKHFRKLYAGKKIGCIWPVQGCLELEYPNFTLAGFIWYDSESLQVYLLGLLGNKAARKSRLRTSCANSGVRQNDAKLVNHHRVDSYSD